MNLLFASSNIHKIQEIQALIPEHINLVGLKDIGLNSEIPETGKTIQENAGLKAEFVANFLKNNPALINIDGVFSDDSGLEVEYLNGAPGVYSARYAGEQKNDSANNDKLLRELKNCTKRQARFLTCIALIVNSGTLFFEGEIKGTISYELRGNSGFGYDPLFIPRGSRQTFGQMSKDEKNVISHRSLAVKKLIAYLETIK